MFLIVVGTWNRILILRTSLLSSKYLKMNTCTCSSTWDQLFITKYFFTFYYHTHHLLHYKIETWCSALALLPFNLASFAFATFYTAFVCASFPMFRIDFTPVIFCLFAYNFWCTLFVHVANGPCAHSHWLHSLELNCLSASATQLIMHS